MIVPVVVRQWALTDERHHKRGCVMGVRGRLSENKNRASERLAKDACNHHADLISATLESPPGSHYSESLSHHVIVCLVEVGVGA